MEGTRIGFFQDGKNISREKRDLVQGFYKLESQGKPYQIQAKSGKSGKVRESQGYLKISE